MTSNISHFAQRVALLKQQPIMQSLPQIQHGVERESLRINLNGSMALTPHPESLGAALTHETITTDFSESLLEFITPPESDITKTIGQLHDIHKFVHQQLGEERLWPMSMPCFVPSEDDIPIAQYGSSNVAKMKTLYRVGLKNRYGSMMQVISGVHFNFSLPEDFWQAWLSSAEGKDADRESISDAYFALIRNYRRLCWLIPYLFGASPALCSSFIKGKKTSLPFEKLGKGTLYLPYATSLRMSDLGYTNSEQSELFICYNTLDQYVSSVRRAIRQPSERFAKFEGKVNGQYQQLNSNVLQIENELYSPIRPKQPTKSLEKPSDALEARGVNYIEVRALDVNPFSPLGIEAEQFYFLDVFLLHCVVTPSAPFNQDDYQETEANLRAVVVAGRDPQLHLKNQGTEQTIGQWMEPVFAEFRQIAAVLDEANQTTKYSDAVEKQWVKVQDPDNTPSAKLLQALLKDEKDNGRLGVELAQTYKDMFAEQGYQVYTPEHFVEQAAQSIALQKAREAQDTLSFDDFLADYFKPL